MSGGGGAICADLGSSNKEMICAVDEGSLCGRGESTVDTEVH